MAPRAPFFARRRPPDEPQRPQLSIVKGGPPTPAGPQHQPSVRSRMSLTASARRIDLRDKTEGKRLGMLRQTWQGEAWAYRRSLGELRYATSYLGNAAQRMRVFPATMVNGSVVELTDDAAALIPQPIKDACTMALGMLGSGPNGIAPILKAITENYEVAGECFLVGQDDPITGVTTWKVRSTSETVTNAGGEIGFRDLPSATSGSSSSQDSNSTQWADPASSFVARLWWPDPEFSALADSPVKAILDVLEELLLLGRDVRATARSRLANNGILGIPSELNVVPNHAVGTEEEAPSFSDEFMATASAALTDEGSAASVVPIIVQGPADLIDKIKHIPIERKNKEKGGEDRQELISRIATGIDLPAEVLTGKADLNHWSSWQVDDDAFRHHIEPIVIVIMSALTEGFLWPVIEAVGVSPVDSQSVFLWYDPTELVTKPDRTADAIDAFDRDALSLEALREYMGFTEADAPSRVEILERIILKTRTIDPSIQQHILKRFDPSIPDPPVAPAAPPGGAPAAPGAPSAPLPPVKPAESPAPADGPPNDGKMPPAIAPAPLPKAAAVRNAHALRNAQMTARLAAKVTAIALAAASTPPVGATVPEPTLPTVPGDNRSRTVQAANRQLVDIDRRLRERLIVAANTAVKTALSRAGAKIVSKSRTASGASIRAAIMDVPQWQIPFAVGPSIRAAAGIDEHTIIDGSLNDLHAQWNAWVSHPDTGAQKQALRAASRIAGLDVNTAFAQIAGKFKDDADKGWDTLQQSLRDRATDLLKTGPLDAVEDDLEFDAASSFVDAGMIRGALALAGGFGGSATSAGLTDDGYRVDPSEPMGQIGTGDTIGGVLEGSGAQVQGYQWVHGASANPFEPHEALDGLIFTAFDSDALATGGGGEWVGDFYTPGDHAGCSCDFVPVWVSPEDTADGDTADVPDTAAVADTATADDTEPAAGAEDTAAASQTLDADASPADVASSLFTAASDAEPALTASMTALADTHGGTLEGLDFRLKTEDSLARKIAGDVDEKGVTASEAGASLFDTNRYTMTFAEGDYAKGTQAALDDLRSNGYTTNVKNYWNVDSNPYQGVNTQVTDPSGQRFELQFHTPESLSVKEGDLHRVYELSRVETDPVKVAEYTQQSFDIAAQIPVPRGIGSVR